MDFREQEEAARKEFWELDAKVEAAKKKLDHLNKKLDEVAQKKGRLLDQERTIGADKRALVAELDLPNLEGRKNFLGRALGKKTAPRPE